MSNIKGFSLVELMVAVGIVGVMSSVAVPKYQKYKVNATRAEAQATLSAMYTLQQLHYTENDVYGVVKVGGDNEIGFPPPSGQKYTYEAGVTDKVGGTISYASGTSNAVLFIGTAVSKSKLGSCSSEDADKWCINQDKVLTNDGKTGGKDEASFTATPPPAAPCVAANAVDGGC